MPMNKAKGYSLLEVLIALGIILAVIPFGLKMFFSAKQTQVQSDMKMNLRSIGRTIENFVDCAAIPKTCTNGQLVNLPKKNGGTLIAGDGKTVFASWNIRAPCTGSNQFQVTASKAKETVILFKEKTLCTAQAVPSAPPTGDLIEVKAGSACAVNSPTQLPCNPPLPPNCDAGQVSRGLSLDTFGGSDDTEVVNVFGQRWIRYCEKIP